MKLKQLKNGSIYYNIKEERPERIIGPVGSRVITEGLNFFNRKDQKIVSTKHIRLANNAEVEKYLTQVRKGGLITFLGKLFRPNKKT